MATQEHDVHKLVFIHGMGEGVPWDDYDNLYNSILNNYCDRTKISKVRFVEKFPMIPVRWGLQTDEGEKLLHKFTLGAQGLTLRELTTWNLIFHFTETIRSFMSLYLGDVIVYTTKYDNHIRAMVWNAIQEHCQDSQYSIVAHSLGSVIAFDYLYKLFCSNTLIDKLDAQPTPARAEPYKDNFVNFFTFGSPIGLFALRKGEFWLKKIRNRKEPQKSIYEVKPEVKAFDAIFNPVAGEHRRWLNFFAVNDPIAYPLEGLFKQNGKNSDRKVRDIKVSAGLPVFSHVGYWTNRTVAQEIAAALPS